MSGTASRTDPDVEVAADIAAAGRALLAERASGVPGLGARGVHDRK